MEKNIEKSKCVNLFLYSIITVILLSALVPLISLCLYVHPSDNDNFYEFNVLKEECLIKIKLRNFGLNKRYSASLMGFLFPKILNDVSLQTMNTLLFCYRFTAFLQICLTCFSCYYLAFTLNKFIFNKSNLFLYYISTVFFIILVNSSSYIYHTFYELVSASGYTTGLWLSLLLIALLINNYYTNKKYILIALVIFLICGMLEIYPIVAGFILFYFFMKKIYVKKQIDIIFIIYAIFIITVFLLMIFNPCQKAKLELYGSGDWIASPGESRLSLHQLLSFSLQYGYLWFNSIENLIRHKNFIATLILIVPVTLLLLKNNKIIRLKIVVPYYLVIAICAFSFHYCFLSIIDLQRANNIITIFLSLLNLLFFISIAEKLILFTKPVWNAVYIFIKDVNQTESFKKFGFSLKLYFLENKKIYLSVLFILITSFTILIQLTAGNKIANCTATLINGSAERYNREQWDRYATIINSNDDIVYVNKLSNPPIEIFYMDSITNSATLFFDKQEIRYVEELQ